MSSKPDSKKVGEAEKVSPLTPENLLIITELANIGLNTVREQLIPKYEAAKDEDNLNIAKMLAVAGAETVKHFDDICRYLQDTTDELTPIAGGDNSSPAAESEENK